MKEKTFCLPYLDLPSCTNEDTPYATEAPQKVVKLRHNDMCEKKDVTS